MRAPVGGNAVDPDLRLRARVRRVASEYRTLAQQHQIQAAHESFGDFRRFLHEGYAKAYERAAEMLEAEL